MGYMIKEKDGALGSRPLTEGGCPCREVVPRGLRQAERSFIRGRASHRLTILQFIVAPGAGMYQYGKVLDRVYVEQPRMKSGIWGRATGAVMP
jgi:hypothetical protein